eukprot:m.360861 g.360861  ORF g.360861 m.360861 type:complete len:755 (-) comp19212_c0_seq1:506-2770(-)
MSVPHPQSRRRSSEPRLSQLSRSCSLSAMPIPEAQPLLTDEQAMQRAAQQPVPRVIESKRTPGSPSISVLSRFEPRRGTLSPRIGFPDKSRPQSVSVIDVDMDDDDLLSLFQVEMRFYVSNHCESPPKLVRHVSHALQNFEGTQMPVALSQGRTLAAEVVHPRAVPSSHGDVSVPVRPNPTVSRGSVSAPVTPAKAGPLPPPEPATHTTSSTTASSRQFMPAHRSPGLAVSDPPPLATTTSGPRKGRPSPLTIDTSFDSPMGSPSIMSPSVVSTAKALAHMPDSIRMSPIRSPLASFFYRRPHRSPSSAAQDVSPLRTPATAISTSSDAIDDDIDNDLPRTWGLSRRGSRAWSRPPSSYAPRGQKCCRCGGADDVDLIECATCGTWFHAGCEKPPLDWVPTKAFCSSTCFDVYKCSDAGKRLFSEYYMMATGYFRRHDSYFTPDQLPMPYLHAAAPLREDPTPPQMMQFNIGQVVSFAAHPTKANPRTEWLAVIRAPYMDNYGRMMYYVNWLKTRAGAPDSFYSHPVDDVEEELHDVLEEHHMKDEQPPLLSHVAPPHVPPPPNPVVSQPPPPLAAFEEDDEPEKVTLPNGETGIRCTCGRIFKSGQALGGHRGKCKVPRVRQRDREAMARAVSTGVPYVPPAPKLPSPQKVTAKRRPKAGVNGSKAARRFIEPSGLLFNPTHYELGPAEPLAQPQSAIVRGHNFFYSIPPDLATQHIVDAQARFSRELLDETQDLRKHIKTDLKQRHLKSALH